MKSDLNFSSRLVIISGASGAGKTFFAKMWLQMAPNTVLIPKYVSYGRIPQQRELESGDADLIFASDYDPSTCDGAALLKKKYPSLNIQDCFATDTTPKLRFHNRIITPEESLTYTYGKAFYQIDQNDIEEALGKGLTPLVRVRNFQTIRQLLQIYPDAVVVYVQCVLSRKDLIEKLIELGDSEEYAADKANRNLEYLVDYVAQGNLLPPGIHVVVNDFTPATIRRQIKTLITAEQKKQISRHSVFIIQSFADANLKETVKKAVATAVHTTNDDAKIHNAENNDYTSAVMGEVIWEMLDAHDIIICDITSDRCNLCEHKNRKGILKSSFQGVSANVWLELGYAIAKMRYYNCPGNEKIIITCHRSAKGMRTELPSDLSGIQLLIYESENELAEKLIPRFRRLLAMTPR